MADFNTALERTLRYEGGYSNDQRDGGGETIFGISRKAWPNAQVWKLVDEAKREGRDPEKYPQVMEDVKCLYHKYFWMQIHGDDIESQDIANALFDFAVNSGVPSAVKGLQRALVDIEVEITTEYLTTKDIDGIIGSKTLKCMLRYSGFEAEKYLCARLKMNRLLHILHGIGAGKIHPSFAKGLAERAMQA